jgi:hypothetical protein
MILLAYALVIAAGLWASTQVWDFCHYDEPWRSSSAIIRRTRRRAVRWFRGT